MYERYGANLSSPSKVSKFDGQGWSEGVQYYKAEMQQKCGEQEGSGQWVVLDSHKKTPLTNAFNVQRGAIDFFKITEKSYQYFKSSALQNSKWCNGT